MQIAALLALKVCDPASGSGHFLIAAARRIAHRLAQLRSGDEEPSPSTIRHALREVIAHCIYGVDINPMAVELCKVNLWLEALEPGKPLTFLDAHIKCGNSLVGVGPRMDVYDLVIPDEAFNPVTGDDKKVAAALKKRNKQEREGQLTFDWHGVREEPLEDYATRLRQVEAMPEDDAEQVAAKAVAYEILQADYQVQHRRLLADLWTAAFFWRLQPDPNGALAAPTQSEWRNTRLGKPSVGLAAKTRQLADENRFFHWSLEFPDVFDQGGFDCLLGNPPWERIKLQEEEFFAQRDPEIATAPTKAVRKKLIGELTKTNSALASEFEDAKHAAECVSKFVRVSERYPLTAFGDVNTYALFAEHFRILIAPYGFAGIIMPTGIATDDTTKNFFGDLVASQRLAQLWGFENEAFIFPGVHHAFKFCALVISGQNTKMVSPDFVFFCRAFEQLRQPDRHFNLSARDIALINPNTLTMPVFRTRMDAELTCEIYRRVPVLENEQTASNAWGAHFLTMFHMSNDSGLFFTEPREDCLPLYEAKMFWHFDHRYTTYEGATQANLNAGILPQTNEAQKISPSFQVKPRYWVPISDIENRLVNWDRKWLIGFRDITSAVVERTAIFCFLPRVGIGNNAPLLLIHPDATMACCLVGNFNALVLDFVARQKVGGSHMNFFIAKQLPVLSPDTYSPSNIAFIASRVLELVYTAYELKPFAEDIGYHGEPFRWDEERRALLRSELDAYYAKLYGLTRDELRYILDPQDVYGPDFPGETFRVLKEKEIKQYGEYRTRRLVLEAWDRLEGIEPARIERPAVNELPVSAPVKEVYAPPAKEKSLGTTPPRAVKERPVEAPLQEPLGSDFGLYKCEACGKMVMGFEKDKHAAEVHRGKKVEWKKLR